MAQLLVISIYNIALKVRCRYTHTKRYEKENKSSEYEAESSATQR
jgi:hypothetical protein